MAYTTINKSTDYFNTKLYSGNSSTQSITGINFQPDMTWIKARSGTHGTENHNLYDSVRGATKFLIPNGTTASTTDTNSLTAFDSDGFSLGTRTDVNGSAEYVAWNWLANGTGSANTDGSINSTVSANTTAGFSIVSYTGTGSNATVGHGLGVAPKMMIFKNRSASQAWCVYHDGLSSSSHSLHLNETSAEQNLSPNPFNSSAPTSTLINLGGQDMVNKSSDNHIAYCFAEKTGYSKFGSYTGNGSTDGTFVYTGFAPKFVLLKITSGTDGWWLVDDKQANPYPNPNVQMLVANTSAGDNTSVSPFIDIYSNGFKLKSNWSGVNGSGSTYIYMAFGQSIVGSNNVPAVAR